MTDYTQQFLDIENAAHDGAFGHNNRSTPTDSQCLAGNYKVGRVTIHGMPVSIEQPRNSYRSGTDKSGKRWSTRLAAHYGYFTGTRGADGDPVDCFIGPYPQAETAWIINQHVGGGFDEHKVMLAFPDEQTARSAYLDSYDRGWNGLHSMVPASISQLRWWLKNGNLKRPLKPDHLPYEGLETMNQRIIWDSAQPQDFTYAQLLYHVRLSDSGDGLILDSVGMADILAEAEEIMVLDALVSPYSRLQRKMEVLKTVMERVGGDVKPVALQVSEPYKQGGVAQVAAVFELSDGQTISIFFHNPDVTPAKIAPTDELISWKWMLNKKDITIVVAPEKGDDLNVKIVAERIIKLAEKNSAAFQRANTKRAENLAVIESLKAEIPVLEKELSDAQKELELVRFESDNKAINDVEVQKKADEDFAQAIYQSLIDDYGWQNQSTTGGPLFWITKTIGGGREGGVVNPNGDRRVSAKVQGNKLVAMWGDNPLVSVDIDREADAKANAGKLDAAVNAEDPRYVAPVAVQETLVDYLAKHGWTVNSKGEPENGDFFVAISPDKAFLNKWNSSDSGGYVGVESFDMGEKPVEVIAEEINLLVEASKADEEIDPITPEGYSRIKGNGNMELRYQDALDSLFQFRIAAVWQAMKAVGWEGTEKSYDSTKNGFLAKFNFKNVGVGANVVGYWVEVKDGSDIQAEIGDNLTGTPADVAAQIDAVVTSSGTVTKDNYPTAQESESVIELTGNELGVFPDTEEGKKALRSAVRDYLESKRGDWVKCPAMPRDENGNIREVEIRQRGIDEFIRYSANPNKLKMAAVIESIIETAKDAIAEPNFKPIKKSSTLGYFKLKNRVSIDGDLHRVTVIIEQDLHGYLHYDFMVNAENTEAALDSSITASASTSIPATKAGVVDNLNIYQKSEMFNEEFILDAATNNRMVLNLFIDDEEPEYIIDDEHQDTGNQDSIDLTQPHIDTLQSIVDGNSDSEDLDALLDKIDAAASALESAGLADQYDELIGKAATKWAELDQKANG